MTRAKTAGRVQTKFQPIKVPRLSITTQFKEKKPAGLTWDALLQNPQIPLTIPTFLEKLQGLYGSKKLLGSGVSGTTYAFYNTKPTFLKMISSIARGRVVWGQSVTPGQTVAIKIIRHTKNKDVLLAEFDREVQLLTYIQKREPVVIRKSVYKASSYTPKMHLACHLPGLSIIVESYAPGKPLAQYRTVSARAIARFERAILSLWLAGVAHADLHSSNIMYDDKTKKMTIIDFGRAILLSGEAISTLRRNLVEFATSSNLKTLLLRPDALQLVSKKVVVHSTDITYVHAKIKRYLDDEEMIQHHIARRCLKPTCTKEALAKERLVAWVPYVKK